VTRPRWRCGSADYYTCGTYGFMMNEVGESHREAAHCPRCTLAIEDQAREMLDSAERRSVLDQVSDLLAGLDDDRGELRGVCWTTRNPMAGVIQFSRRATGSPKGSYAIAATTAKSTCVDGSTELAEVFADVAAVSNRRVPRIE
jgi:hypothetical protein